MIQRDEYVDVAAEAARQAQRKDDQSVIEAISESLADGSKKQTEIITYCRELKLTEKKIRTALRRYSGDLWSAEKVFEKNAWRYELICGPRTLPTGQTRRTGRTA